MDNNSKALKSGFFYIIANFLSKGLLLISTPIFARILTKSEFGDYSNFASWLTIAMVVVTLNVEATLVNAKFDYSKELNQFCFNIALLSSVSACFWLIIVNIFNGFAEQFFSMELKYINIMLVYLIFIPVINIYQNREQYFYRYKKATIISFSNTAFTTICSILFVIVCRNKLTGRIVGQTLPTILLGIVLYFNFWRNARVFKASYWKYALPICLPYIPHLLSLSILNAVDRIMIQKLCGSEYTALYSMVYMCGSLITLLLTSMNNAFSPWLGEKLYTKDYNSICKFSYKYILIFMYMAIGVMLLAPEVLLVMGGRGYVVAKYIMPPITMGCACQFLYTLYVNVEQFQKKTIGMALASLSAAMLNYILNFIFIPKFGYEVAAYTTLIGYLWLLILHMLLVKKLNLGKIYDNKFVIIVVFFMLLITLGINVLYKITFLRYIIIMFYIVIMCMVIIKNKEKMIKYIKHN